MGPLNASTKTDDRCDRRELIKPLTLKIFYLILLKVAGSNSLRVHRTKKACRFDWKCLALSNAKFRN